MYLLKSIVNYMFRPSFLRPSSVWKYSFLRNYKPQYLQYIVVWRNLSYENWGDEISFTIVLVVWVGCENYVEFQYGLSLCLWPRSLCHIQDAVVYAYQYDYTCILVLIFYIHRRCRKIAISDYYNIKMKRNMYSVWRNYLYILLFQRLRLLASSF
jgi:hypothetical protein